MAGRPPTPDADPVYAVILAAGRAARYGGPKQLARYRGQALVERAVRLAEAVCGPRCVLVTGTRWRAVAAAAAPLEGYFIVNDRHAEGMGSSIAAGVRVLPAGAGGVLVMLGDQPLLTTASLSALLDAAAASRGAIVCSRYRGTLGPPVVFPRAAFESLAALSGERGARSVIDAWQGEIVTIDCPGGDADVDTPADLEALPGGD